MLPEDERVAPTAVARKLTADERRSLIEGLAKTYGDRLAVLVLSDDVSDIVRDAARRLISLGVLRDRRHLLTPRPALESGSPTSPETSSALRSRRYSHDSPIIWSPRRRRLVERTKSLNWRSSICAVGAVF